MRFNFNLNLNLNKRLFCLSLLASTILMGCGGGGGSNATSGGGTTAPVNTAPVLAGQGSLTVAENQTAVASYTATDAQGDTITFSINGTDAARFTIDQTGVLAFISAPDFDAGDTGPFNLNVVATDNNSAGPLASQLAVQVTVSNEIDPATNAVVQTVTPTFTGSSEVMLINGQTQMATGPFYIKNQTDYRLSTYKTNIYHIGSYFIDTIEKYDASNPDSQIWSYTTQDSQDSVSRNPYSLVSLNETKAYLIRYGSEKIWIVNPQAQTFENFKTGELILEGYSLAGNASQVPNAAAATIHEGKLYVAMQRWADDFSSIGQGYIAVFDTATDTEIETNSNAQDNVKGIVLQGINPLENSLVIANDKLYVTTNGEISFDFNVIPDLTTSKIEEISLSDYSTRTILSAASLPNNSRHQIKSTVIVSSQKGYFYAGYFDETFKELSTLYEFNPTTGEIINSDVTNNANETISYITLDPSNILWLSAINPGTPGIDLIDTATNTKIGSRILTDLNPQQIKFIQP